MAIIPTKPSADPRDEVLRLEGLVIKVSDDWNRRYQRLKERYDKLRKAQRPPKRAGDECPACHRAFGVKPVRVCWDCKRQIRKGDKWRVRPEDGRVVHRHCNDPEAY